MSAKYAVYTACFGNYDYMQDPLWESPDFDFFYFSEAPFSHLKVWKHLPLLPEANGLDLRLLNRLHKIKGYRQFAQYKYAIYIDSNILCVSGAREVALFLEDSDYDMMLQRHPHNHTSLQAEVESCIFHNKYNKEALRAQYDYYISEGFNNREGRVFENGLMVLNPHSELTHRATDMWWEHLRRFTPRDQISLPFVLQKHVNIGLKVLAIPNLVRRRVGFVLMPHLKKEKPQQRYDLIFRRWKFKAGMAVSRWALKISGLLRT